MDKNVIVKVVERGSRELDNGICSNSFPCKHISHTEETISEHLIEPVNH